MSGFGIAALVLGILGLLVAWVPLFGMAAVPVAGIGGILGIVGIIICRSGGKPGMGWSVAGTIVCGLAIIVAYASTLRYEEARRRQNTPTDTSTRVGGEPAPDPKTILSSEPRVPVLPKDDGRKNIHFP